MAWKARAGCFPTWTSAWNDTERRGALLRAARIAGNEPALIASSAHLLAVARRPA